MKNAWKTIAAVVPGPALLWVSQWLGIFSQTHLALPDWQQDADAMARALGTFVAIFICMYMNKESRPVLRRRVKWSFCCTIFLIILCWAIWFYLGVAMPAPTVKRWQDIWQMVYVVAMVMMVATISMGALSLREASGKKGWLVMGVLVFLIILLACAAAYFWFQHAHAS